MEVEAVALEALARGSADVVSRYSFAPGEAKALAVDSHDGVAAVLVVRRRRDDAWIVDVVRLAEDGGGWIDLGSEGGLGVICPSTAIQSPRRLWDRFRRVGLWSATTGWSPPAGS